jgi:hypothetical protein
MKKYFIFSFLFIYWIELFGQTTNYSDRIVSINEFKSLIDTIGLLFEMPQDYHPTFVKENGDLAYSFAIINKDSSVKLKVIRRKIKVIIHYI